MFWSSWQELWGLIVGFPLGAGLMWLLWRIFGKRFGWHSLGKSLGTSVDNSAALQDYQAEIASLEARLKANRKTKDGEIASLQARLKANTKTKDSEIARLAIKAAEADTIKQKFASAESNLKTKDNEIARLKIKAAEADKAQQELARNDKHIRDLEIRLKNSADSAQQALSLQANLKSKDDELMRLKALRAAEVDKAKQEAVLAASTIQARDDEIARLIAELQAAKSSRRSSSSEIKLSQVEHDKMMREAEAEAEIMRRRIENKEIEADNLQEINGVGKVMEGRLNDFGVFTFEGVANLSKAQRYRLAQSLSAFRDRIDRDNWVGQANALYTQQYIETKVVSQY